MNARTIGIAVAAVVVVAVVGAKVGQRVIYARQKEELVGRVVYDERADGHALVAAALARASAEHKRVLVTLGGNWCLWCLALDKLEHEDTEIHAALESGFVSVKLDSGTNEDLDKSWGTPTAHGVPVLVILEPPDGKVVGTQETISLESMGGKLLSHDREKVLAMLHQWAPKP